METFDAVIIGSGAGGAPIAYKLAEAGKSVLVLEKGPLLRTQQDSPNGLSDFKRDELYASGPEKIHTISGVANTGAAFYTSHIEPDLNDEPHLYSHNLEETPVVTIEGYTAHVVGGGTQLYGAVSLRFTPDDFRLASVNAGRQLPEIDLNNPDISILDWPISYSELESFYAMAEKLVGINGSVQGQLKPFPSGNFYQTPLPPNPISTHAKAGMDALGMNPYRTPLAVITQDHAESGRKAGDPKTGFVNRYGDPMGFKSNTWVSLLRPAIRKWPGRITLRCNCVVTHLSSNGSRVTTVHYRSPDGSRREVSGKIVVVACSAIESVRLLMLSAEEDRPGFGAKIRYEENDSLLGRYFLTHCFGGAEVAIKGKRYDKSISLDSDWATDFCARPEFIQQEKLWAGGAIYNNTSDQALPISLARTHRSTDLDTLWLGFAGDTGLYGDRINGWLDADFGTRLSVSFMANQIPWFQNHIRLSNVRDKWNRKSAHIVKDWHPHDGHVMRTLARYCEEILLKGVPGTTPDDIEEGSVYGNGVRIANHILGGARFGTNRNNSVLDKQCRVWDFDNLYVTDGSFMPTSGGANPTLTIQANAFRVGQHLATQVL